MKFIVAVLSLLMLLPASPASADKLRIDHAQVILKPSAREMLKMWPFPNVSPEVNVSKSDCYTKEMASARIFPIVQYISTGPYYYPAEITALKGAPGSSCNIWFKAGHAEERVYVFLKR
jgi:hypothetical protein